MALILLDNPNNIVLVCSGMPKRMVHNKPPKNKSGSYDRKKGHALSKSESTLAVVRDWVEYVLFFWVTPVLSLPRPVQVNDLFKLKDDASAEFLTTNLEDAYNSAKYDKLYEQFLNTKQKLKLKKN